MITREVALTQVWLDARSHDGEPSLPPEPRQSPVWRILALLAIGLFFVAVSRADSITDVSAYLQNNSALSFGAGIADELSLNLINAQSSASYGGPISLLLSEDSVLKAITLYVGSFSCVCSQNDEPVIWAQSQIAINPAGSVSVDPPAINLGSQTVPEPATYVVLVLGGGILVALQLFRKKRDSLAT